MKDNFIVGNGDDDGQIKYALSRHAYNYRHIHPKWRDETWNRTFIGSCISNTYLIARHTFLWVMIGLYWSNMLLRKLTNIQVIFIWNSIWILSFNDITNIVTKPFLLTHGFLMKWSNQTRLCTIYFITYNIFSSAHEERSSFIAISILWSTNIWAIFA